jgi:hypothetical protein
MAEEVEYLPTKHEALSSHPVRGEKKNLKVELQYDPATALAAGTHPKEIGIQELPACLHLL